jgi:hypothetical protein
MYFAVYTNGRRTTASEGLLTSYCALPRIEPNALDLFEPAVQHIHVGTLA